MDEYKRNVEKVFNSWKVTQEKRRKVEQNLTWKVTQEETRRRTRVRRKRIWSQLVVNQTYQT